MRTAFQMCDTFPVIHRGTADDAVYVIAFFQQKFRQIAAILTGHAGDQCSFHKMTLLWDFYLG